MVDFVLDTVLFNSANFVTGRHARAALMSKLQIQRHTVRKEISKFESIYRKSKSKCFCERQYSLFYALLENRKCILRNSHSFNTSKK
jgi:hypothetical protein